MKMSRIEKRFVNSKKHAQKNIKVIEQLFGRIDLSAVNKVLEIGCGAGIVAAHLCNEYKMNVTGTDVDPEQIETARKYNVGNENLKFIEADASKLPFGSAEFDMVLSQNVLHHIGNWEGVLQEVNRVLKPKGYYFFTDLAYSRLTSRILRPIVKNYGVYTIDDIINSLRSNGIGIAHTDKPKDLQRLSFLRPMKFHNIVFQKN